MNVQGVKLHTPATIAEDLDAALAIIAEREIDGELKVPAFQLVFGALAQRQAVMQPEIGIDPGLLGLGRSRH